MKTLYITEDREKELQLVETPNGLQIAITWRGYPSSRMTYQIVTSERAGLAAALLDASTDDDNPRSSLASEGDGGGFNQER